jgi:hypothetical protein
MEIIPYLCIIFNTEAHFIAHKAEKCHLFRLCGISKVVGGSFSPLMQKRVCADGYSFGSIKFNEVSFIVARDHPRNIPPAPFYASA